MKTISMDEILELYRDIHADPVHTKAIRTNINQGTLNNRLNSGSLKTKLKWKFEKDCIRDQRTYRKVIRE